MSKLKHKKENDKIKQHSLLKKCDVPDSTIFFSFQYITEDKKYNINYFDNNKGDGYKAFSSLIESLERYSQSSWTELSRKGKKNGGYELIEYGQMKKSISNGLKDKKISDDTKLYVFRFHGNDFRFICYKSNRCKAAAHIIGFDFDFSLYDHG